MTEQQHPIIPPPQLVQEWLEALHGPPEEPSNYDIELATRAAQWGADQELKACCKFLEARHPSFVSRDLRAARRPKPTSLKEQALADFNWLINRTLGHPEVDERSKRILQALESLSND
jgi:hypothetical protein